jgi:hypothetical protein
VQHPRSQPFFTLLSSAVACLQSKQQIGSRLQHDDDDDDDSRYVVHSFVSICLIASYDYLMLRSV